MEGGATALFLAAESNHVNIVKALIEAGADANKARGDRITPLFIAAHEGHVHISRQALARLGLDAVWWVVSPQNPLKTASGMAPFADRLAAARKIARDPRIVVTDIEARLDSETLANWQAAMRMQDVEIFLPRFTLTRE